MLYIVELWGEVCHEIWNMLWIMGGVATWGICYSILCLCKYSYHIMYAKNWSDRNEVTETSGRLHPLSPQNKWLHTPWTADYRHTRQDRWIQTELAFTLAKNATKPNPFEIILQQTTRKENNWKTEEALEKAVVIVETERIRGSNHWCLWRWWFINHDW